MRAGGDGPEFDWIEIYGQEWEKSHAEAEIYR